MITAGSSKTFLTLATSFEYLWGRTGSPVSHCDIQHGCDDSRLSILHMPQLLAVAIMIFILSLVPVAGVIISTVPLSILGYAVGGIKDVVTILILLLIVHTIETYVLNPKLMSSKTELPIFYTFVVLLAE